MPTREKRAETFAPAVEQMLLHNPQVSVVMPTYNRGHLIGRSIRSVLNQTYPGFELIIVDDGSNDGTQDVVRQFDDGRIRYIRHEDNRGAAAARNTGIRSAAGAYVAFQDSDDEWLPRKLERQMAILGMLSHEVGVLYSDMWRIGESREEYYHAPHITPDDGIIYTKALANHVFGIGFPTAVLRRECFDRVGMLDEELRALEDSEFYIRLSKHFCFYHLAEPLVNQYVTPVSVMHNPTAVAAALKRILNKYHDDISREPNLELKYQVDIGLWLRLAGQTKEARAFLGQAASGNLVEACRHFVARVRAFGWRWPSISWAIVQLSFLAARARTAGIIRPIVSTARRYRGNNRS